MAGIDPSNCKRDPVRHSRHLSIVLESLVGRARTLLRKRPRSRKGLGWTAKRFRGPGYQLPGDVQKRHD